MVAPLADGRQLTVYENQVGLDGVRPPKSDLQLAVEAKRNQFNPWYKPDPPAPQSAMILPVPVGKVRVLDLSEHKTIFSNLKEAYPRVETYKRSMSNAMDSCDSLVKDMVLEVREVGSYLVSVAPRLEDLNRIDPVHFKAIVQCK